MKLCISAGAAVLHAASTLTGQSIVTREGALLSFQVDDLDLDDTIGALHGVIEEVRDAILKTDNDAEIAGLTDLQRALVDMERDVRIHFQLVDAAAGRPGNASVAADADGFTVDGHLGDIAYESAVVKTDASEPAQNEVGSHPTATGDDAISNAPQQTSEAVNEETELEPSQPQPKQPARRPRRKRT